MGQWVEATAAEVRALPDGARARLYSTDLRGTTQWLDGFVWHTGRYSAELRPMTLNVMASPVPVRAYKGKTWRIMQEGEAK